MSEHFDTDDVAARLLALVNDANYQPVKPKVLGKKLGLSKEDAKPLRKLIKKLARQGSLAYGKNHLVRSAAAREGAGDAAEESDRLSGVFRRTSEGHGYVLPEPIGEREDRSRDVYIARENAGDAASGDTVLVRVTKQRGRRGRPEGVITDVIERDTHQFVGVYFEDAGQGYVQVDGAIFSHAILVGDPGAKNAREDDKVVFEMVRFPSHAHEGEGVITEVLGSLGQPGVDTLSIIREFELPDEFGQDVLQEAREQARRFNDENVPPDRIDLTAETVITIDPVDARDFDDAISLSRADNGHWLLGVHIADVSHFVPPGGPLDREAYDRATSAYLPDRVIPMLPEVVSNGLASLQPDKLRYTKSAFLELTAEGVRVAAEVKDAAIRSKRRFTYEEVDDFLDRPQAWERKLPPEVFGLLERMHELAMILRRRRFRRGALELQLREVKVDLDEQGRVCGAHVVQNTESHQMIEEFMLAANEAVAELLRDAGWPFLRRIHASPSPRKSRALTTFVRELRLPAENLQDRFELQRLLKQVAGKPEQQAVNYAVLRSLPQAVYSPADEGHFALAADCYCHFTSPIRRYPDLTIHRLLNGLGAGKSPTRHQQRLDGEGVHCSQRERRAEAAERELTKVKLLSYLSERIGEQMDAVITGVESFGLFAAGLELPAEGLIHISSLDDDYYHFDRRGHRLVGNRAGNTFRLGDLVRVRVARVDIDRRELDFRLVDKRKRRGKK